MTLKIVDHDKPGMFCISFLCLFFFFNSEVKIHCFFWKIVEYTYGSIHFSGMTELTDLQTIIFKFIFIFKTEHKQKRDKTE